jgi:glycine/D-amino acid oxidase-like deaminating enzyme
LQKKEGLNLSYWERETWFSNVDFCIIGSGIVGLSCALQLRAKHPQAKILVLERGILPQGASTKNAGFACFGSMSELLSDLQNHSEEDVFSLVQQRVKGLDLLKKTLGEKSIDFQQHGGFEIFTQQDVALFEKCEAQVHEINQLLYPIFKAPVFSVEASAFGFEKCLPKHIVNAFEGQIDTGKMMQNLLKKVQTEGILVLNATEVLAFESQAHHVEIQLKNFHFKAKHLCIATNAFASSLLNVEVTPARNQVLITSPIPDLKWKGTFHINEGYFYFRNIHDRILLGGGRHLDKEGETTTEAGTTNNIQKALEQLLYEVIMPHQKVTIDTRWSGVLGVGKLKKPIVQKVQNRVYCAVRLGGMGVAIGSMVGRNLANLIEE